MTARRQLLFLSQSLPYPPHSGVQTRTFNILRQLQQEFDVTVLPFSRRNHHRNDAERREAARALATHVTKVLEPVPIAAEYSRVRFLRDHVLSLITRKRYTDYLYQSEAFANQLKHALATTKFDLVHIDSLDLACFYDLLEGHTVVCTHHDIDSILMARKATQVRWPLLRQYVALQARLVRTVETSLCHRFAANLVMSERDAAELRSIAPKARIFLVPNGVDTHYFSRRDDDAVIPGRLCFIGPTYMFPNRDAIEWFLDRVWPSVRRDFPSATLEMVGRNPPGDAERYAAIPGVITAGYVDDLRANLSRAACSVVPIRVGGGTRLKILDAWSFGVPVVSTTVGCEGLNAVDGENIIIRDEADQLAAAVVNLLRDRSLRGRIADAAERTVAASYSWDRIGADLRRHYNDLLASRVA